MKLNHYKTLLYLFFAATIGYHFFLNSLPEHNTIWNNIYGMVTTPLYLIGSVAGFMYLKKIGLKSYVGKSVLLLSISTLFYSIGLFYWGYLVTFTGIEIPYPSFGDILFVLYGPLAGIGLLILFRIYRIEITTKKTVQLLLLLLISGAITYFFIGLPVFDGSNAAFAFNLGYVLSDFVILSISLAAITLSGGRISGAIVLIALSFLMQAIGDFLFTYQTAQDTFWDGNTADLFFSISGLLLSLGIIKIIRLNIAE